MKTTWNLEWDYKSWEKNYKQSPFIQDEWNQTLTTKINQISAQINMVSHFGGADTIKINSSLLPLFESLTYLTKTDNGEMFLSNKYKVIIDNKLNKDRIYVYLSNIPDTVVIEGKNIFIFKKNSLVSKYKDMVKKDSSLQLNVVSQRKLQGKIIVKNFICEKGLEEKSNEKNKNKSFFSKMIDLFKMKIN